MRSALTTLQTYPTFTNQATHNNQQHPGQQHQITLVPESPEYQLPPKNLDFNIDTGLNCEGPPYDVLLKFYATWVEHVTTCSCCQGNKSTTWNERGQRNGHNDDDYFKAYTGAHTLFLVLYFIVLIYKLGIEDLDFKKT